MFNVAATNFAFCGPPLSVAASLSESESMVIFEGMGTDPQHGSECLDE